MPSDAKLNETEHALNTFEEGKFNLIDKGYECAASLRIGVGSNTHRVWTFEEGCRFSVGIPSSTTAVWTPMAAFYWTY